MRAPVPIAGLDLFIFLVIIAWVLSYSQQAIAQYVVYPTNTLNDQLNVQAAVNQGGTVLLKATDSSGTPTPFYFGEPVNWTAASNLQNNARRVLINNDVKILGEKDNKGNPLTKINGGVWSFYSTLPTPLPSPLPRGPDITIEGLHFDGAFYAPILIRYASGLKIVGNRIENVHPFAIFISPPIPPVPATFTDRIDSSSHQLRIQQGISIGSPFAAYVMG